MIKKNLKLMIFTSLIILAPMVFGLIMWNELPAEMATHFGTNGEPDGWSSKILFRSYPKVNFCHKYIKFMVKTHTYIVSFLQFLNVSFKNSSVNNQINDPTG